MRNKTNWTLFHIILMLGVTVFFSALVQLDWVPQWVQENSQLVPQGQMLAYAGYFGVWMFILTCAILTKPKIKIKRTVSNVLIIAGQKLHNFTTIFVDLVSITIIAFTFINLGYDGGAEHVIFWSNFCFIAVFPYLGFFTYWATHRQKLEYVKPIFSTRN